MNKLVCMEVVGTIESVRKHVRAARAEGARIGFVPTMGALHIGHISLIEAAVKESDYVVVSIFVNPTQFGGGEDFEEYPRPLDRDVEICAGHGVDLVFAPSSLEMYKSENVTWVNVEKLTGPLCGRSRPGHFRGVCTVCAKLFNIVMADVAFFGQKDAQQAIVIKRMAADLNMPLEIVVCPTIREPDGLAVSSRNQYLSGGQRKDATAVYECLRKCREMILAGAVQTETIITKMRKIFKAVPSVEIEYISIVDAETLEALEIVRGRVLAAVAVRIGPTRLIDNIVVDITGK